MDVGFNFYLKVIFVHSNYLVETTYTENDEKKLNERRQSLSLEQNKNLGMKRRSMNLFVLKLRLHLSNLTLCPVKT